MSVDTFKKAGIFLHRSPSSVVPEIPYTQDVLYALRLSEKEDRYTFCVNNHALYVANVGLVIAVVGSDVVCMEKYDEAAARKIIAQAILDLTATKDKCLFDPAITEAMEILTGQPALRRTADRETIIAKCECASCAKRKPDQLVILVYAH